jgi:hypothetical protein
VDVAARYEAAVPLRMERSGAFRLDLSLLRHAEHVSEDVETASSPHHPVTAEHRTGDRDRL